MRHLLELVVMSMLVPILLPRVQSLQQLWDAGVYYEAGCEDEPYYFYFVAHQSDCTNDDPCVNYRKICGVNKEQETARILAHATHKYIEDQDFKREECSDGLPDSIGVVRADGKCYPMPTGGSYLATVNPNGTFNYRDYSGSQKDCKNPNMNTNGTKSGECLAITLQPGLMSIYASIKLSLLSKPQNSSLSAVKPRSALCCATSSGSSTSDPTSTIRPTSTPWTSSPNPIKARSSSKSSTGTKTGSATGTSTGIIVGIIAGVVALGVVVGGLVLWKKRSAANAGDIYLPPAMALQSKESEEGTHGTDGSYVPENESTKEIFDFLKDPRVVSSRIPLKALRFTKKLGCGAFGEVYIGEYLNQTVAIKRLLPAARQDLTRIKGFAKEIKLMAAMNHKNIIAYIGAAWLAIQDLCVVEEYMNGGSVRDWLVKCKQSGRANGFDREKLALAAQIAEGLTYLHTLDPPVLHRDLKSSNVLLNDRMEAKLTDFGESRLGLEGPMTGEVGTTLWMAPEVITHEQYDERADIYSFGMLLIELDTHELPFATLQEGEKRLGRMALMTQIAMNQIHASFSVEAVAEVVTLGMKCLSYDPNDRPAAPKCPMGCIAS